MLFLSLPPSLPTISDRLEELQRVLRDTDIPRDDAVEVRRLHAHPPIHPSTDDSTPRVHDNNDDDIYSNDDDDELQARRVVKGVLDVLQAGHGVWPDDTRSEVAQHEAAIRRCFLEASSAEDVLQRLSDELSVMGDNSNGNGGCDEGDDDDRARAGDSSGSIAWLRRTMGVLQKKNSPMSLQLTYEQLRRGASMDLKQCLTMVRPIYLLLYLSI